MILLREEIKVVKKTSIIILTLRLTNCLNENVSIKERVIKASNWFDNFNKLTKRDVWNFEKKNNEIANEEVENWKNITIENSFILFIFSW